MSKYLVEATYTAGNTGLAKDKASGRKAAINRAVKTLAESSTPCASASCCCLGERDVILIVDMPDNVSVAALSSGACESGMARTTPRCCSP